MNNPSSTSSSKFSKTFHASLAEALTMLDITLDPQTVDQFARFTHLLREANARMNLTGITTPEDMAVKHFADSLSLLLVPMEAGTSVIDIGTGVGFPGLPIAIARPDLEVVLLDATIKKVNFLNSVISEMGLSNCKAVAGRSEVLGHEAPFRESFDAAVWRGLGTLDVSVEICMPLVRVGGIGIAMKGPKLDEELVQARQIIGQIGGKVGNAVSVNLPGGLQHRLLVINKEKSTPASFPREWKKIKG